MNKHNLEILGLEEGCTQEQINEAYEKLREKYGEERFLDGEAGNEAARMLTKIRVARDELLSELSELESKGDAEGGSAYSRVEELIKSGDLSEAQRQLDQFNERGAQWHYLQSVIFYRKNWINESKKQLEIAMHLDAENEKYKEAYKKLNDKIEYDKTHQGASQSQNVYSGQTMNGAPDDQMGGGFCQSCAECCAINACLNCLCSGCCR